MVLHPTKFVKAGFDFIADIAQWLGFLCPALLAWINFSVFALQRSPIFDISSWGTNNQIRFIRVAFYLRPPSDCRPSEKF